MAQLFNTDRSIDGWSLNLSLGQFNDRNMSMRDKLIFLKTFSLSSLSLHHDRLRIAKSKASVPKLRTLFSIVDLKKNSF